MTEQKFTAEEFATEEWRDIPNTGRITPRYELRYQVSNLGRVRSLRMTILRPNPIRNGYRTVGFWNKESPRGHYRSVHSVVAQVFISPRPKGMFINHKDGNKMNNRLSNLEYVTPRENNLHAVKLGLAPRGERAGNAKLSEEQAKEAVKRLANGESARSIAARYNVSAALISYIKQGKTWKHIPRPDSRHVGRLPYAGRPLGEDAPNAKITVDSVRCIRKLHANGKHTIQGLADTYGIGWSQTARIINRQSWKHVD